MSKRKSPSGISTSNLILTAHVSRNAEVFEKIMTLHVPDGSVVADVTWGKGAFWKYIAENRYILHASDLQTGIDCTALPYGDASHDCVVFDPPYMHGFFEPKKEHLPGKGSHQAFCASYSNREGTYGPRYHAGVLDLYFRGGKEACRILKDHGILIVKCQDEVSSNRQCLTHIEIVNEYEKYGFYAKDLFVVVRAMRPNASRVLRQVHARKNHSYFIVFIKNSSSKL